MYGTCGVDFKMCEKEIMLHTKIFIVCYMDVGLSKAELLYWTDILQRLVNDEYSFVAKCEGELINRT